MARPGISYEDVKTAATRLLERGLHPSIQRVRDALGTGSNSTIADHLKRWQQELNDTPRAMLPPSIPEAVMSALEAFWQVALQQADAVFEQQRQQGEQAIAAARQERDAAQLERGQALQEAARLQQQIAESHTLRQQVQDELLLERERRRVAEETIDIAEQQVSAAVQATDQVRAEAQARIAAFETDLQRQRDDSERRLAEAEQRFQDERARGEANDTRLLRIIDQNRTEHAGERQQLTAALNAAQQRETQLQEQLQILRSEHAALRSQLAGAEERSRLLDAELERTRTLLAAHEQRTLDATRELEALRTEHKLNLETRHDLEQALADCRHELANRPLAALPAEKP